jgi:predicted SprT family Zn-dependent metalloprotease
MTPDHATLLAGWGTLWGVPDLAGTVTVTFSTRLKRSLGRCRPASGRITLQAALEHAEPALLAEVLCHEAAHVAAHRLSDGTAPPHGALWQDLVRAAGYEPRTRRPDAEQPGTAAARAPAGKRPARFAY